MPAYLPVATADPRGIRKCATVGRGITARLEGTAVNQQDQLQVVVASSASLRAVRSLIHPDTTVHRKYQCYFPHFSMYNTALIAMGMVVKYLSYCHGHPF